MYIYICIIKAFLVKDPKLLARLVKNCKQRYMSPKIQTNNMIQYYIEYHVIKGKCIF